MESPKILTISDLLKRTRPLTGAASLHPPTTNSKPYRASSSSSSSRNQSSSSDQNPNPNTLSPLNHPAVVVGTLGLPSRGASALRCSRNSCFSFSDSAHSMCCDVLNFELPMIGREIRVLAWNFIPFDNCAGGFLEIIRWSFSEPGLGLLHGMGSSSVPLALNLPMSACEDTSKALYSVYGILEAISPVTVVPCATGVSSGGTINLSGFLAQVRVCKCRLCKRGDLRHGEDIGKQNPHSFSCSLFVYFTGPDSSWHPVMSKLVGSVITLSGLKKKLVFIVKESSQLMYMTTAKSVLHSAGTFSRLPPSKKITIEGKGECASYSGTVRGIHMQGMVVELDNDVWLLLTNQVHFLPHSLRVGAIISVKNVHVVNPKFSWTKMLLLGACSKTSLNVDSYSLVGTGCHIVSPSQSLLGKFVGLLAFSARIWVLLITVCLRKKFAGILSDKELLGSKHCSANLTSAVARSFQKEGLAQVYANSILSSSVSRAQHGVLMEFCNHDSCGSCGKLDYGELKLVVPISYIVVHSKAMWIKAQLEAENCEGFIYNNDNTSYSCKGRSYNQPIRRIFSSEETGFALLGSLKLCPCSGRLKLSDATGSIDVIISGLPSTWNAKALYEIIDYSIIVEGMPEEAAHLEPDYELFSCRSIFHSFLAPRDINDGIFAYFCWKDIVCRDYSLRFCSNDKDNCREVEHGNFDLLFVTHKYPPLQKFPGEDINSSRSSMFAEVIFLPWNLFLFGDDLAAQPNEYSEDKPKDTKEYTEQFTNILHQNHVHKRRRTELASGGQLSPRVFGISSDSGKNGGTLDNCLDLPRKHHQQLRCCTRSSKIPCLAKSGYNDDLFSATLCCTRTNAEVDFTAEKVLLEFDSNCLAKYQLLQIGRYYITRNNKDGSYFQDSSSDYIFKRKVSTSETCLRSLLFLSDGADILGCQSLYDTCSSNDEVMARESLQNGLPPKLCFAEIPRTSSDIILGLPADANHFIEELRETINPYVARKEVSDAIYGRSPKPLTFHSYGSTTDTGCLLSDGKLISLHGNVVAVHGLDCTLNGKMCYRIIRKADHSRSFDQLKTRICIHVLLGHDIVRISGTYRRNVFPVGFGPGISATFHRILESSVQSVLLLIPVSFIVINSIIKVNDQENRVHSESPDASKKYNDSSQDFVSPCLISGLFRNLENKIVHLSCRVVAIHVVVLEKSRKYDGPQEISLKSSINVPLAGFIVDDGSGSCCCWANPESAVTLLQLQGDNSVKANGSSYLRLNGASVDKPHSSRHLARLLEKHGRIIVRNYSSVFDSSCQDFTISVCSNDTLSCSDEDFLKRVMLSSCFATVWNVIGEVMDSKAIALLETQVSELQVVMNTLPNVWANEVHFADPVVEARSMIHQLLRSVHEGLVCT